MLNFLNRTNANQEEEVINLDDYNPAMDSYREENEVQAPRGLGWNRKGKVQVQKEKALTPLQQLKLRIKKQEEELKEQEKLLKDIEEQKLEEKV